MNETKLSSPPETRRKTSPTPPPTLAGPAEVLQPDTSPADPLEQLLVAEEQGERWLILSADYVFRASEIRRVKMLGYQTHDKTENGQQASYQWPVPNLEVNGEIVTCPEWTLAELIKEIGVEVVQSPSHGRTWKATRPQTRA